MKRSKNILLFIVLLSLVALACNAGTGVTPPAVTIPADISQQAAQAATQAAQLAATAAAGLSQGNDVIATAQAVATTVAAQGGDVVATAQALATAVPISGDTLQTLKERFATVQLDGNGNATVTITDDELTQAIATAQAQAAQNGQPITLQNVQATFTGGNIILAGDVTQPVQARLTVTFRPYIQNNVLQFEVIAAQLGQINVPPSLLDSAEITLNNTLSQSFAQLPAGVVLQDLSVGEGTMTITVKQG